MSYKSIIFIRFMRTNLYLAYDDLSNTFVGVVI